MNQITLNTDTLNDAANAVSSVFKLESKALHAPKGNRLHLHARGALLRILFDNRYSRADISKITGLNPVTIWHWLKKWEKYIEQDERTRRVYLHVQIRFAANQARTIRRKANQELAEIRTRKSPTN